MELSLHETDPNEPPIFARVVEMPEGWAVVVVHREGDEATLPERFTTRSQARRALRTVGLPEDE